MLALIIALALAGPHADHQAQFGAATTVAPLPHPALLPDATPGPDRIVYGYEAYWNADLNTVPWDELSHLAIFSAEATPTGGLSNTSRWDRTADAVAIASAYGVKVHLCVTNFDTEQLATLLSSASNRRTLIDNLVAEVARTGAHGVNVDFESMPSSQRANMVTFVRDLAAEVDEVVLATPAVDWSSAWDYGALSEDAWLFIMGYGYHWSGSDYAGPNDPLYGRDPWSAYSLDWSVQDYLDEGADPDRVILGLPLYGNSWPVSSTGVPAPTTGRGSAVVFSSAWSRADTLGATADSASDSLYYNDSGEQTWFGDTETVRTRVQYAEAQDLGGVGFWALHYTGNSSAFWAMMHDETAYANDPGDPGDPGEAGLVANAGRPFLAYVGDTVILSAEASAVPDQGATYRWEQVGGPLVTLSGADTVETTFTATRPGVVELSLEVGDGSAWSAPNITHVIVIDRGIGEHYRNCSSLPAPALLGLLSGLLLLARRRS